MAERLIAARGWARPVALLVAPVLLVLGVLACSSTTAVAASGADTTGSIDHVTDRSGSVQVLFSLPDSVDARPDLGSVSARLDGTTVPARATLASSSSSTIRRTAILAIDVSRSMAKDGKFAAAKRAARAYLRSIPDNVYVGIVSFAGSVHTLQSPSLDRSRPLTVISRLRLSLGTNLYQGVSTAVAVAGVRGQRNVLVLSDGRDTSGSSLTALTRTIRASHTAVDVVALGQQAHDERLLAPLSAAGRGRVISADDPRQLTDVFSSQAHVLANEILVTVTPPAGSSARDGTLSVSVDAGGTTYADSAYVALGASSAPTRTRSPSDSSSAATHEATAVADDGGLVSPRVMLVGVVGIGLSVVVVAFALMGGMQRKDDSLAATIAPYTGKGAAVPRAAPKPSSVKDQALDVASKALASNHDLEARLAGRLDAAGTTFKPAEWLLLHAGIAAGATVLAFALTGADVVLSILGLVGGVLAPWLYLGQRRKRRLKTFNGQLAGTLQLMAGSLQAGLSLGQGMDTIVREGADPVAGEFRRALVETRLGVSTEDALDALAERMQSDDFRWTVMAIRIQREVGGNLAELMLNVAATLRERDYLRRQVKSLSAEGRFSAYILLAMPPGVLAYEMLVNHGYLDPLVSTPIGWALLALMGALMGIGGFMMMRMIKLEV